MNRQMIIAVIVLVLLVLCGGGGGYIIVTKQLERYALDEKFYTGLESKVAQLEKAFSKTKPDIVMQAWEGSVDPWNQRLDQEKGFFTIGGDEDITEMEGENTTPFYHYEDQFNTMVAKIQSDILQKGIQANILPNFGAPMPSGISKSVKKEDVHKWLRKIAFGSATVNMLLDSKPAYVTGVSVWPAKTENEVLEMRTVGLSFMMTLPNLVEFVSQLTYDNSQYYNINAIKIANRQMRSSGDPLLEVQMLVTRAKYLENVKPKPKTSGTTSSFTSTGSSRTSAKKPATKSWWEKLWPF